MEPRRASDAEFRWFFFNDSATLLYVAEGMHMSGTIFDTGV